MSFRFEYDEAAGVIRHNDRELNLADPEPFELISRAGFSGEPSRV